MYKNANIAFLVDKFIFLELNKNEFKLQLLSKNARSAFLFDKFILLMWKAGYSYYSVVS